MSRRDLGATFDSQLFTEVFILENEYNCWQHKTKIKYFTEYLILINRIRSKWLKNTYEYKTQGGYGEGNPQRKL